jgi:hypothetical protein
MTVDVEQRLQAAAERIRVEVPPPAPVVAAGRRRGILRGIAAAAVIGMIGAGTTWALVALGSLRHDRPAPATQTLTPTAQSVSPEAASFAAFWGATVPIPAGWFEAAPNPEVSRSFVASTSQAAIVDGPLHSQAVGSSDAWITVSVPLIDRGCEGSMRCGPFPDPLVRGDLRFLTEYDGAPLLERWGTWGRSTIQLMFWVGPDATPLTRAEADFLLASLGLPGGLESYSDPEHQFSIEYPDDWVRSEEVLTPRLASPHEIFAAGTYSLRAGGESCLHFPVNAMEDLGPSDVLVWIAEAKPFGGSYPRPESFPGEPPDPELEARYCLQDPNKPYTQWWISFSDGNRSFYVLVAMGNEVTDERKDETWRMLDSFDPAPSPATPGD